MIDVISKHKSFAFYGAQVVAYGAYVAIKHLYKRVPECFVVSSLDNNPSNIEGIPVETLGALPTETLIIIAVTELLQNEIVASLGAKGYCQIFKLTAHEEHLLMSEYYASMGLFPPATKKSAQDTVGFSLFEVRHHLDKPLQKHPKLEIWEIPVQAGAELADHNICSQLDNTGDNISSKNKQYCEASIMYWVWKNAKASWVGIEHYRRHLLVTPEMLGDDVDAIMPLPYICYPNPQAQFRRFVSEEAVNVLFVTLKDLYPNEYDRYMECLNGKYHYAYNLIAAKLPVFGAYCEWAFKVTDYIEALGLQSVKDTRALAYIIEMLTSIYFIANQKNLNIRHAEKAIFI